LLQEHWLKGVNTDEDKREHKVVYETTNEVFGCDALVEVNSFETCFGL
jgi:hypothetical protein